MDVKNHRKIISVFFGILVIMYLAKIFGILDERFVFIYRTKTVKVMIGGLTSLFLAYAGAFFGTGGTPTSKGIDIGLSPDSIFHHGMRGKSHTFIVPSLILVLTLFSPDWLKPLLIGYGLGYAIHIITDFFHSPDCFIDKKFLLTSFIVYTVVIVFFELS